jgi:hypothetical protein
MKGDIDRSTTVESHGWEVLVEKRFKHDDFVAVLKESSKDGILPCK